MFALAALICFVISPWQTSLGDMPMVTLGLAFVALHLLWAVALPWSRQRAG